jgi:hypothetical protein
MGAPIPEMAPVENPSAEALLDSLKTIDPTERRKHASVFNYWQAIRGPRQFPPIRDLDPLEISDAGPWSVLLEMIGGGEDAVIRHFGQEIRGGLEVEKIVDAPSGSLLSRIHAKLPIVAACREAFAFEDSFESSDGPQRCWVSLLPFSSTGTWIDFVYGYVSLETEEATAGPAPEAVEEVPDDVEIAPETADPVEVVEEVAEAEAIADEPAEEAPEPFKVELRPFDEESEALADAAPVVEMEPEQPEPEPEPKPEPEPMSVAEPEFESNRESEEETTSESKPSFTAKVMESLASVGGFYGKVAQSGPQLPTEAFVADETETETAETVEPDVEQAAEAISEPASQVEGPLHSKLSEVRALAEEAREAQVRSNVALYEGLSAAYDFALEAEDEPEEYLRLVEAQGLKIQLRSPMKPVVKLAFDGMCDEPTIKQLETVLAWALKQDLPKGTLAERIQAEGGIGALLNGQGA